jgi:hypothetical protein
MHVRPPWIIRPTGGGEIITLQYIRRTRIGKTRSEGHRHHQDARSMEVHARLAGTSVRREDEGQPQQLRLRLPTHVCRYELHRRQRRAHSAGELRVIGVEHVYGREIGPPARVHEYLDQHLSGGQ